MSICLPVIDPIVKQTLQMRQTNLMSPDGQQPASEPSQYFFEQVAGQLVDGCLKNLINLTTDKDNDHYTSDMPFFTNALWNFIYKDLITDGPLSFFTSTGSGNLEQLASFAKNYRIFIRSYQPLFKSIIQKEGTHVALENLMNMFNLDTFMNLFQIQIVELFQGRLAKSWNCTNDQLTSIG